MVVYRNTVYFFADSLSLLTVSIANNGKTQMDHYERTFFRVDNPHQTQWTHIILYARTLVFYCHRCKGFIMANSDQEYTGDHRHCSHADRTLDLSELSCIACFY